MIRGRMLTNHLNGRRKLRFSSNWHTGGMKATVMGQARWRFYHTSADALWGCVSILTREGIRVFFYKTA